MADALVRRPVASAAILFILGIISHPSLTHRPGLYLILAGGSLLAAIVAHPWRAIPNACISITIFLTGLVAAQIEAGAYPANHIGHFTANRPRLCHLELRIEQPPRILGDPAREGRRLPPWQVTQARVLRILTWDGWRDADGIILLQVGQPHAQLAIGQRILALGMLDRPRPAMNPGQFDWAAYYREQRIIASLRVAYAANIAILESPGPTPLQWLRQKARQTLEAGFSEQDALDCALLRALVLGDADPQLRDVQDAFQRTGTSHHLAISGMHITVLGAVIYGVCRLLFLSPRRSAWIGLACVILYGAVALPSPPVIRSVIFCVAVGIGLLFGRAIDLLQLLAVSVLAMLIYHPLDIYNAGFQLSFGTVLGLMLFANRAAAWFESMRDRDIVIAESLMKPPPMARLRRWIRTTAISALVVGVVAWLVSAPLILWHFQQLNPWSVAGSLLLAIPVFVALVGGWVKIILTMLIPGLAGAWAAIAAVPIAIMRNIVEWLARLPGSDVSIARDFPWAIPLAYLLLLLPLIPPPKLRLRPWLRVGPAGTAALLFCLPLFPPDAARTGGPGELRLTLLSVGAGQCTVVHLPDGQAILIDAGSSSISDLWRRCIRPYLRYAGNPPIRAILVSHADYDHSSALPDLLASGRAGAIHTTPFFRSHAEQNVLGRDMLASLQEYAVEPLLLSAGDRINLGDVEIDVLWPPAAGSLSSNDSSHVLRLSFAGRSILFTGDILQEGQRELLRSGQSLRADVLIAPHHGSRESTTGEFLAAVGAEIVLSSNDATLSQKQRGLDALMEGRRLYRTHACGAIWVTIGRDGRMELETFIPPPRRN